MTDLNNMYENDNRLKLQRLYENYKNTMYSVAYDILKNPHDAEDVVENSLIKTITILSNIAVEDIDNSRGKNLMITITKNAAIDFLRKRGRTPEPCAYIEDYALGKDAEELYIEMENYQELISCITEMDEKYRDVLRLRLIYHLSAKETGEILNINEHHVNMRLLRARAIMAKKLKEHM